MIYSMSLFFIIIFIGPSGDSSSSSTIATIPEKAACLFSKKEVMFIFWLLNRTFFRTAKVAFDFICSLIFLNYSNLSDEKYNLFSFNFISELGNMFFIANETLLVSSEGLI